MAFASSAGVPRPAAKGAPRCARRIAVRCAAARVSRRHALARLAAVAAAAAGAAAASAGAARADDISALVTPYRDLPKGFSILRPAGWNEFEGSPDAYDVKWADVIQPLEFVTVMTNPVAAGKTIDNIGPLQAVGEKLAESRGGKLLSAKEKDIDGVKAYVFEIQKGAAHQITLLAVNKSKLYSVNASSGEKRWKKRERLLKGVVDSFQPRL